MHNLFRTSPNFGIIPSKWSSFLAGILSGPFFLIEKPADRTYIVEYLSTRAIQSLIKFTSLSRISSLKPLKTSILKTCTSYLDVLIFCLSSSGIIYSYMFRPETLHPAYRLFLGRLIKVSQDKMDLIKDTLKKNQGATNNSTCLVASDDDKDEFLGEGSHTADANRTPPHGGGFGGHVLCEQLHPNEPCGRRILSTTWSSFCTTFPMYFSLHLVAFLLFKRQFFAGNILKR